MARGVGQIELVADTVCRLILHGNRVGFDGDSTLALEVHRIKKLFLGLPLLDRSGKLQQAVGEGRFPMVNVRDDAKIAGKGDGHRKDRDYRSGEGSGQSCLRSNLALKARFRHSIPSFPPIVSLITEPFRLNRRVFQMIGVLTLALALPLGLVLVGVRTMMPAPSKPTAEPPEVPGLRASLEQAAGKLLPAPELTDDAIRISSDSEADFAAKKAQILDSAARLKGSVLESGEPGHTVRLLVQLPPGAADAFEENLPDVDRGAKQGCASTLYEILLLRPEPGARTP